MRGLCVTSTAEEDAACQFALLQCLLRDGFVGTVCLQARAEGPSMTAGWQDYSLGMWWGMPGFGQQAQLCDAVLVAAS